MRSWAGHFAGIRTALAGSPGEGAGESGRESGKWSFLARIEREGRVPELMLPPPLEVLSLGGEVAAALFSGENAASYTGLDRVKGMKSGQAETRVKGID